METPERLLQDSLKAIVYRRTNKKGVTSEKGTNILLNEIKMLLSFVEESDFYYDQEDLIVTKEEKEIARKSERRVINAERIARAIIFKRHYVTQPLNIDKKKKKKPTVKKKEIFYDARYDFSNISEEKLYRDCVTSNSDISDDTRFICHLESSLIAELSTEVDKTIEYPYDSHNY